MATENPRVSSTSITGVAPVTVYSDSVEVNDLDSIKYRTAASAKIYQYSSSNFINLDDQDTLDTDEQNIDEITDAPFPGSIIIEENVTYLDATGKSKARVVFKVNNTDIQNISDVDVAYSMTTAESGK
jgi:hypothetical protein